MATCSRCSGSGDEECHGCCGRGWHYVNWSFLGTSRLDDEKEDCGRCGGTGKITCVHCNGSGDDGED